MKRSHLVRDIVEIVAITVVIFIALRFTIQSYYVNGTAMQPGLKVNEFVLVNKVAYRIQAPQRGDIIVFHYPLDTAKDYIKRIIGLPGDTITMDSTHIQVNGLTLNEPYISAPYNPQAFKLTVPPDHYFVMSDNRVSTDDSRTWGTVPRNYIIGKAVMVFWPLLNMQFIDTFSSVYQQIKAN